MQAGLPLANRALNRSRHVGDIRYQFAVAAQCGDHKVVSGGIEFATIGAVRAIIADLQIVLGVPTAIGTDDSDVRQVQPHCCFEFRHVEAEGSVAKYRENRCLALNNAGCAGDR